MASNSQRHALIIAIALLAGRTATVAAAAPAQAVTEPSNEEVSPEALSNITRRAAKTRSRPTTPPESSRDERQIDLADLSIVLRKVPFDKPIEGRSSLYFSETEITNKAFAAFLNDSGLWRDDTELETVHDTKFETRALSWSSSRSIHIKKRSALWRNGAFPAGQDDHPVTFITMGHATDFCRWLTARYELGGLFRLPTEEEWLFAAYGVDRKYPWGNDVRKWTGTSTQPVKARPSLRTPDGLYCMWGNVAELVLSPSDGYGGTIEDIYSPIITTWQGPDYEDEMIGGEPVEPRQDYWGYTHSAVSLSDTWGFRIVFAPANEATDGD